MFEKISYSIEGEDLILASIFNNENKGYYLDIGCNHPVQHSNTYLFYLAGWRGLCIDPNVKFKIQYESFRPEDSFISAAVSCNPMKETISYFSFGDNTLNSTCPNTALDYTQRHGGYQENQVDVISAKKVVEIFAKKKSDAFASFLNIDIEGGELEIISEFVKDGLFFDIILVEIKKLNLSKIKSPIFDVLNGQYSLIAKTPLNSIFINRDSKFARRYPKEMI
jgi:FkbM family methyltransferase